MLKRICITGPESTGKSWLAKKLAEHYQTIAVPEFAVEYLTKFGSKYQQQDILAIAKGQLENENQFAEKANKLLFCDTSMIVCKIWSQVVFNNVDEWIDEMINKHKYDLYLLTFPDIRWKAAPFRENPENREYLYGLYEQELMSRKLPYRVVTGLGNKRLENAVNFVDEII